MHSFCSKSLLALLAGSLFFMTLWAGAHEDESTISQDKAEAWMQEVIPILEQVSGREIKTPPPIECVSTATLSDVVSAELLSTLNRLNPEGKAGENQQVAQLQGAILAQSMLGKYDPESNKLLLVPENFSALMKMADIPSEQLPALVKITIAHELTHYLQDREIDLTASMAEISEAEPMQSFNAAIEGQAILFHELAGQAIEAPAAVKTFEYLMPGGGFLADKFPEFARNQDSTRIYAKINYNYGPAYMRKLYTNGGAEATWDALAEAPVELDEILTARSVAVDGKVYLDRIKGVEMLFDSGPWNTKHLALDEAGMSSQFDHLPAKTREQMLDALTSSSSVIAAQSDGKMVMLSLMTMRRADQFPLINSYTQNMMRSRIAAFQQKGLPIKRTARQVKLKGDATLDETTLLIGPPESKNKAYIFFGLLHQDRVVAQLMIVNLPPPSDETYQEIANRLFD